ncbi:CidA/LrgA family protein [Thalassotalea sp. G2M2-11]|uniref:CidA/LrgA family protein n=1 Tax=Thalassotalea sp. G2M2-11 TaxID=2787627 RepID=UPI0019D10F41|nr:CidA/LrgA family protein [Thalassotalea sp. G2M2-11]
MFNALYSISFICLSLALGYAFYAVLGGLPPSLYGMIIFTLLLHFRLCQAEKVKASIDWGIRHMGVCFVPAGVGIMNQYPLIKQHGLALVSIIFITTFLVLTFVGVLYQRLEDR